MITPITPKLPSKAVSDQVRKSLRTLEPALEEFLRKQNWKMPVLQDSFQRYEEAIFSSKNHIGLGIT